MKKIAMIVLSIFAIGIQSYTQDKKADFQYQIESLQSVLSKKILPDTSRVIGLNHLARLCIADNKYEKGLNAAIEARTLAKKIKYVQGEGMYLRLLDILRYDDRIATPYHILTHWYYEDLKSAERKINISPPKRIDSKERTEGIEKAAIAMQQANQLEMAAHLFYLSAYNEFTDKKFDQALQKIAKAEPIFAKLSLDIPLVSSKVLKAKIFEQLGRKSEVLDIEHQMTQIIENHTDARKKTLLYNIVGFYFYVKQKHELALEYLLKSVNILENLDEKYLLATVYFSTGFAFHYLGSTQKSMEYLDKSWALIQSEKIYDLNIEEAAANFYPNRLIEVGQYQKAERIIAYYRAKTNDIGYGLDHESRILMARGTYKEALEKLYQKNKISGVKNGIPNQDPWININIAKCLNKLGRYNESNQFALLSYKLRGSEDIEQQKTCNLIYENYEKLGQSAKAIEYLKRYVGLLQKEKEKDISNLAFKIQIEEIVNKSNLEKARLEKEKLIQEQDNKNQRWLLFSIAAGLISALIVLYLLYRNNRNKQKANNLLHRQKEEIGLQRAKAETALSNLKSTQAQLIQSEKLASLGELTAGIAHEIQNPLNFVNNFSEVSAELVAEMNLELDNGDIESAKEISNDLKHNLDKIQHHGKRASSIVKGMLEHSRTNTGLKELTDINALADEYLRLAYHGLRAKDSNGSTLRFNSNFKTDFDENLPKIEVIPQDIGRVLLNLINNAFYAVKSADKPLVVVSTKKVDNQVIISVIDNGSGMPQDVKAKIFQPFFTTKPTGQGTGLGLSLAYDIVTKGHRGTIEVESVEGEGSEFIITLPNKINER